jgi:hypothetical protein
MNLTKYDCESSLSKTLYELFILRIVLNIIIYVSNINPWIKIILILLLDHFKRYYILYRCKKFIKFSHVNLYHHLDKIVDLFGYILVYKIVVNYKLLSEQYTKYLLYILLFRIIGDVLYYLTQKRTFLFLFPDLFKEGLLLFAIVKNKKLLLVLFIITILIKLYIEYLLHIKKELPFINLKCHKDCNHI